MPERNSTEFYLRREQQERALASACTDPVIVTVHADIADRYGRLDEITTPRWRRPPGRGG